jgi:integrase
VQKLLPMNKKKFCVKNVEYTIVIGVRTYLEYRVQYKTSQYYKRKRVCKGFAAAKNLDELYILALAYIERLKLASHEIIKPKNKLIEYLENNQYRLKERTYQQFLGVANRFVIWCDAKKIDAKKATLQQIESYYLELTQKGVSNNTLANNTIVLKSIFNGLMKYKTISENPFTLLPKIKRDPKSLKYFNDNQINAIKNHCQANDKQLWLAIQLLYYCFIRPAEMRLLTLWDIDLIEGTIEVRGEIAKNGKTQKVLIPNNLIPELKFIMNYPSHYFLFGNDGVPSDVSVSTNYFNKRHKTMLDNLRMRDRHAFYSWKHTGVVKAVKSGINLKELQLQLRHSSLEMVDEYLKNLGILDSDSIRNDFPLI